MKRRLSQILWSFTLATGIATAGCAKKEAATYSRAEMVTAGDQAAARRAPRPMEVEGEGKDEEKADANKMIIADATGRTPDPVAQNSEDYTDYGVNPLIDTANDNLSTFAIDVDTASYTIARRKVLAGQVPPAASVRVEEFVNYFDFGYEGPAANDNRPFSVHMDAAPSPYTQGRHLLRVGVQGKKLSISERKPANLVFLVDVSGSMSSRDKLGLAKQALRVLVQNLKDGDSVALVTYAGNTRVVLEPTPASEQAKIFSALDDLNASGSTAMGAGIDLAYQLAVDGLKPGGISRVIVLSDGDANVGNTSHEEILRKIHGKVEEGVTLSTIGLGMGNYKDTMMEQLANRGNGNYYYIDSFSEAKRVFQEQLGATLQVIAKDIKIQVEFDKDAVKRYRLVGYENRDIADRDFRDDNVDAGEIGAGHNVTAVYEVELTAAASKRPMAIVRVRAKTPRGERAEETAYAFDNTKLAKSFADASEDFRFASAVVGAAEILRRSPHARHWKLSQVRNIAVESTGNDQRRKEFVLLLNAMRRIESQLALVD